MKNLKYGLGIFVIALLLPIALSAEDEETIEVHVQCTTREVVAEINYSKNLAYEPSHYEVEIFSPNKQKKITKVLPYAERGQKVVITEADMNKLRIKAGEKVQMRVAVGLLGKGKNRSRVVAVENQEAERPDENTVSEEASNINVDYVLSIPVLEEQGVPVTFKATNTSDENDDYLYHWGLRMSDSSFGDNFSSPSLMNFEDSKEFSVQIQYFGVYEISLRIIDKETQEILARKEEEFKLIAPSPTAQVIKDKIGNPIVGVGPVTKDLDWQSERKPITISVNALADNPGIDVSTFKWDAPATKNDTEFKDRTTTQIPGEKEHFLFVFARDYGGSITQRRFGPFKYDAGPPIISSIGVSDSSIEINEPFQFNWGIIDHGSGLLRADLWILGPEDNDYRIFREILLSKNSMDLSFSTPGARSFFITATDQAGNSISREQGQKMRMGVNVSLPDLSKDSIIKDFFIETNREGKIRSGSMVLRLRNSAANMGAMHWVLDSPTVGIDKVKVQRGIEGAISCLNYKTVKEVDYDTIHVEGIAVLEDVDPGFYCYRMIVVDRDGEETISEEIRASVVRDSSGNDAPILFVNPSMVLIEDSARDPFSWTFDASESIDPDGDRMSYKWVFDDGTVKTGEKIVHTFASTGVHYFDITVTDDRGASTTFEDILVIPDDPYSFDKTPPEAELRIIEKGPHMVNGVFKGGFVKVGWTMSDSGIFNSGILEAFVSSNRAKQLEILPNPSTSITADGEGFLYSVADGKTFIRLEVTDRAGRTTFSSIEIDENFLSLISEDGAPTPPIQPNGVSPRGVINTLNPSYIILGRGDQNPNQKVTYSFVVKEFNKDGAEIGTVAGCVSEKFDWNETPKLDSSNNSDFPGCNPVPLRDKTKYSWTPVANDNSEPEVQTKWGSTIEFEVDLGLSASILDKVKGLIEKLL